MNEQAATAAKVLEVRGLVKDYPGVKALRGVDFDVRRGEVHCLLGPNGAGKSTLIKCVSGAVEPSGGEILVHGEPLPPRDPAGALARGVATIYQELDLVEDLDVLNEGGFDGVLSVEHEDPVWGGTPELVEKGLEIAHRNLRPLVVA